MNNHPKQRNSSEDIDVRLARFNEDQYVDDACYPKHKDLNSFSYRIKKTTDECHSDSFIICRINDLKSAYQENGSHDYRRNSSYISNKTGQKHNDSQIMLQDVPNTSKIKPGSQYQPISSRQSKPVASNSVFVCSDSNKNLSDKRNANTQDLQYVGTAHLDIYGGKPGNNSEEFYTEDVWIKKKYDNCPNQKSSFKYNIVPPASNSTIDYAHKYSDIEHQRSNSRYSKTASNSRTKQGFMFLEQNRNNYANDNAARKSDNFKDKKDIPGCSKDSYYIPEQDESHAYSKCKNDDCDLPVSSKSLNSKSWNRSDNTKGNDDSDDEEYYNVYLDRHKKSSSHSKSPVGYRSKFFDTVAIGGDCAHQLGHNMCNNSSDIGNHMSDDYCKDLDCYPDRDCQPKQNNFKHMPTNHEDQPDSDISREGIQMPQKDRKKVRIRKYAWDLDGFPISKDKNMKEISKTNTFTMHDACKIAPLLARSSINDNYGQTHIHSMQQNEDSNNCFQVKRKCWTKACWSTMFHSHSSLSSRVRSLTINRNAILESVESPQRAAKSKKQKFSDCSWLKTSLDRFHLFSSTLKKIEGQFGTGVVSYFVFLRWLIILNFVIFLLYFLLIILPYSAFALLSQVNIKIAPNTTLLTEEYLERFPKYENLQPKKRNIGFENISFSLGNDLLEDVSTLLDNYVTDEILDLTLRYDKRNLTEKERRVISLECEMRYRLETANGTKGGLSYLQDFLQGTGWLQSTILFLGSYPDRYVSYFGLPFNLPVSFIVVLFVSFFLSLVLMVQFSSSGIQETILSRKSNYLTFSNILFCSWDYCIEDKKTADIRHKSITCELKSNLTEEHRKSEVKSWSTKKKIKVYLMRTTVTIFVLFSLFGCFYLIYRVVNLQLEKQRQNALVNAGAYTLFIQFLPPIVITVLNIVMPILFNNLGRFEMYDTRTQVNIALFRVVFLRLASVFVLVSSLYQQITCQPKDRCKAGKSEFCRSPICWETYVGQQLYKLVVTDFIVYICMFLGYDLPRDFIVQTCKCKVTEVIGRQVFDLPSQVLSLVYSQTLCWLGLFYSPLLSGITVIKFLIVFYVKKVVVLKHCTPAPVLYKASRSNSIFMMILMISFFVVTIIHGYSLSSIEPSPGCSPFRQYAVIINAIPNAIYDWSPGLVNFLSFVFSGFFFIPSFILLSILTYYYWTVVVAQQQLTKVLKAQIAIEGRDKQFLLNRLAGVAREATSTASE